MGRPFKDRITNTHSDAVAGEDLSNAQFRFIKRNAAGRMVLCDTLGERADGVLLSNNTNEGQTCVYATPNGGTNVQASGTAAIPNGTPVTTDANGRAVATTTAGHYINAITRQAVSAGGNVNIPCDLDRYTV